MYLMYSYYYQVQPLTQVTHLPSLFVFRNIQLDRTQYTEKAEIIYGVHEHQPFFVHMCKLRE